MHVTNKRQDGPLRSSKPLYLQASPSSSLPCLTTAPLPPTIWQGAGAQVGCVLGTRTLHQGPPQSTPLPPHPSSHFDPPSNSCLCQPRVRARNRQVELAGLLAQRTECNL